MKCENHEYKQPFGLKVSSFFAGFIPALAVIIWLPTETNILLGTFLVFCVVVAMDNVHFNFIEKPHIKEWLTDHVEKYHMK